MTATTADRPTENATVEYTVWPGDLPDGVASVEMTLQVVFVTDSDQMAPGDEFQP